VPEDVSVIGFDNVPESALVTPPLTTVQQPLHAMGAAALDLLVRMLASPDAEVADVRLPTALVQRASCGPAPGDSVSARRPAS
jgi:LacI family transcriptional regulator